MDWNPVNDQFNYQYKVIGRYQGIGMEAALETGRQRKSGFAFGASLQLGTFPALRRFQRNQEASAVENESEKKKFLMVGFVFLHHPLGLKNGFYFAIRPGINWMNGVPYYFPVPIPGFSVAMGYDFFNAAKAHLGIEVKMTTVLGIGGNNENDHSSSDIIARIMSYGVAFTVAYY